MHSDEFYMDYVGREEEEDVKVTVDYCLSHVKSMCLLCQDREILKVMECMKESCPLWKIREHIVTNKVVDPPTYVLDKDENGIEKYVKNPDIIDDNVNVQSEDKND